MAGILQRAAFCIQHNFSEVHASCRVCPLAPLHLLSVWKGRTVCPFSLEGPLGDSRLGLSPQSGRQRSGTAFARGSGFPLGTNSPELPSPPAHRRGARAAMLLWAEGRPSCALQTRTQGGHRVGPRGAWPEGLAAGVRRSLQLVVGQRLEAGPLPGFSACHFLTSESRSFHL